MKLRYRHKQECELFSIPGQAEASMGRALGLEAFSSYLLKNSFSASSRLMLRAKFVSKTKWTPNLLK